MKLLSSSVAVALGLVIVAPLAAQAADMQVRGKRVYTKAPRYQEPDFQQPQYPQPYYKAPPRSYVSYYNWTGGYAGMNLGYGLGRSHWTWPTATNHPKGMNIGGTIGYNLQTGSVVYGIEGDLAWSAMKGATACGAGVCQTENNWLGTARGRIGYAFDRFLPYLTGGVAFGDIKANAGNPLVASISKTKTGWALGGGLEYAFLSNWSAKLEYMHVNLGHVDCGNACAPTGTRVDFSADIIRAGVNYKFGGYGY